MSSDTVPPLIPEGTDPPGTPGASTPPSDPTVLLAQALELQGILGSWDTVSQGLITDSPDTLGRYIQVWRAFNELTELQPSLAEDLQASSAIAGSAAARLPCWGVTASGNRSKDCKIRATKGYRCGRHLT